ncbi:hypothetical protein WN48_02144 [Eufriesea mexicana]|uniref:Uncharacterized protein n=1 Tax=Eufriesea mexicana TaxID=516756 RepID=A0A310SP51_9HYME|nr:hypothetical protein WN48_02144 [Eufriesea mexicana]
MMRHNWPRIIHCPTETEDTRERDADRRREIEREGEDGRDVSVKGAKAKVGKLIYDRVLQGWSATGQMRDADQALSPMMAAGPNFLHGVLKVTKTDPGLSVLEYRVTIFLTVGEAVNVRETSTNYNRMSLRDTEHENDGTIPFTDTISDLNAYSDYILENDGTIPFTDTISDLNAYSDSAKFLNPAPQKVTPALV